MALFTSVQAGDWDDPDTWDDGTLTPGDGDTASLGHAVTIVADAVIGTSPAEGTSVITITSGGSLTIVDGQDLTIKGDVEFQAASDFTVGAGCVVEFDASGATDPTNQNYRMKSNAHNVNWRLIVNGTAGNRSTIRSHASGGPAYIGAISFLREAQVVLNYCDLLRMNNPATGFAVSSWITGTDDQMELHNVVLDACGGLNCAGGGATAVFHLENVTTKNSVGTHSLQIGSLTAAISGGGVREIRGVCFDKSVFHTNGIALTVEESLFEGNWSVAGGTYGSSVWDGNMSAVVPASGVQAHLRGFPNPLNTYVLKYGALANPHFLTIDQGDSQDIEGFIFEHDGLSSGDPGDCILGQGGPAGAETYGVRNCILVPSGDGGPGPILVTLLGNANATWVIEHNTAWAPVAAVRAGETYNSHAGMVSSLKSNLVWHATDGDAIIDNINGAPNDDVVADSDADYNGGWNLDADRYQTPLSPDSPGANDVDGDPGFVDADRNVADWDASLGGAGTAANAVAELRLRNEPGYDPNYTIAALIAYVRAGFAPTNTDYQDAGHDGVTIGAIEGEWATPVTSAVEASAEHAAALSQSETVSSEHLGVLAASSPSSAEHTAAVRQLETIATEHLLTETFPWTIGAEHLAAVLAAELAASEHTVSGESSKTAAAEHLSAATKPRTVPVEHHHTGIFRGIVGPAEHTGSVVEVLVAPSEHLASIEDAVAAAAERVLELAISRGIAAEHVESVQTSAVMMGEHTVAVVVTLTAGAEHVLTATILYPIAHATGPALYEPMIGPALKR